MQEQEQSDDTIHDDTIRAAILADAKNRDLIPEDCFGEAHFEHGAWWLTCYDGGYVIQWVVSLDDGLSPVNYHGPFPGSRAQVARLIKQPNDPAPTTVAERHDPAPGPWIIPTPGHVYSQPLYVPAPFTDSKGVRHEDYMAGLVALVYGGPETTALVAEAPTLKAQRDELLAALEAVMVHLYLSGKCLTVFPGGSPVLGAANAAIAKVRDASKGRT